jgi:hypothetical protein
VVSSTPANGHHSQQRRTTVNFSETVDVIAGTTPTCAARTDHWRRHRRAVSSLNLSYAPLPAGVAR